MTGAGELERSYRRWLRCYPRSFRREHENEILGVLMAGAQVGQYRPAPIERVDLLRSALSVRLAPRAPRSARSVFVAVKALYLGAIVELVAVAVMAATMGDVRASAVSRDPDYSQRQWQVVMSGQLEPLLVFAGLAVLFWLVMAWSVGRGHRWAKVAFAFFFAFNLYGLVNGLINGSAVYARPDLAIGVVLCLIELAAVVLVFRAKSSAFRRGASQML